jgi:sodium/potassium-transporting ATPase subunit beta
MAADDVDFKGQGQNKGVGSRVRGCLNGLWNSEKKELFGRTGGSWAKITVFYIVFYSCLAGFFAIMLVGFFSTVDDRAPTMTNMYSLIKQNPGMGYRPMPDKETTLIKFNSSDSQSYGDYVLDILAFLRENDYLDSQNSTANVSKTDGDGKDAFVLTPEMNQHCPINKNAQMINESFGYNDGQPCVLLKINRVYNFEPEALDNTTEHGKEGIEALGDSFSTDHIGISCEGENDGDIDNMGEVEFWPKLGYPFSYYPYTNAKKYRAPLVFAKFTNARKGVVMQIWCKIWAQNIMHHKNDKAGSVHFELMIDAPPTPTPTSKP